MTNETPHYFIEFEKRINKKFEKIDERFDRVDHKFEEIDKKFDAIDARFDVVNEQLDVMNAKFDVVNEKFDAVNEKFDAVNEKLDMHFETIGEIKISNTGIETLLSKNRKDTLNLSSRTGRLEKQVFGEVSAA